MIAVAAGVRVVVAARPVDFRNGLDGLAALVQQALRANPFAGDLFVFRAKRADRVKILAWDGTGLCLFHKRLEKGRFVWPAGGICERHRSPWTITSPRLMRDAQLDAVFSRDTCVELGHRLLHLDRAVHRPTTSMVMV
jgi:transposase